MVYTELMDRFEDGLNLSHHLRLRHTAVNKIYKDRADGSERGSCINTLLSGPSRVWVSAGEADKGGLNASPFKQALLFDYVKPVDIVEKENAKRHETMDREGINAIEKGPTDQGEFPLSVSLDENEVLSEELQLQSLSLFFISLGTTPARGFLEEWVDKNWEKNNILFDSFQYQGNGVFMIFFQEPSIAKRVLDKKMWHCGNSLIKVIPWDPDVDVASLKKNSEAGWMEIKGLDPALWKFIRDIMHDLGEVLKFEHTNKIVNASNVRFLFAPSQNKPLPKELQSKELSQGLIVEDNLIKPNGSIYGTKEEEPISDASPPVRRTQVQWQFRNPQISKVATSQKMPPTFKVIPNKKALIMRKEKISV
eukprot:Gb_34122 [translate_table: standard]